MSLTIWVSCAVGLMTNMILQMSLQIKRYTKSMRTGSHASPVVNAGLTSNGSVGAMSSASETFLCVRGCFLYGSWRIQGVQMKTSLMSKVE
eukprot:1596132-Amphidinium_carterae.1